MGNLSSNVVQIDLLSSVRMRLSFFIPSLILMLFSQAPLRCLSCYTCPYLQLRLEILLPSLFGRFWGVLPKKFSVPHLICRALCSPSNSDFLVHTSPRPLNPTFASMFTPTVLIVCNLHPSQLACCMHQFTWLPLRNCHKPFQMGFHNPPQTPLRPNPVWMCNVHLPLAPACMNAHLG